MEVVGHETCDRLTWIPGEDCRNKNAIIKQGIPKKKYDQDISFIKIGFWLFLT